MCKRWRLKVLGILGQRSMVWHPWVVGVLSVLGALGVLGAIGIPGLI
jgi:hypothetical protein